MTNDTYCADDYLWERAWRHLWRRGAHAVQGTPSCFGWCRELFSVRPSSALSLKIVSCGNIKYYTGVDPKQKLGGKAGKQHYFGGWQTLYSATGKQSQEAKLLLDRCLPHSGPGKVILPKMSLAGINSEILRSKTLLFGFSR